MNLIKVAIPLLLGAVALQACATSSYVRKLNEDVAEAPYSKDDYIPCVFDCSNMGNMLREYLLGKGYDVKLLVYWTGANKDSHTLVLVDNQVLVDPVLKTAIRQAPSDFPGAIIFSDPELLKAYTNPEEWSREWTSTKQ